MTQSYRTLEVGWATERTSHEKEDEAQSRPSYSQLSTSAGRTQRQVFGPVVSRFRSMCAAYRHFAVADPVAFVTYTRRMIAKYLARALSLVASVSCVLGCGDSDDSIDVTSDASSDATGAGAQICDAFAGNAVATVDGTFFRQDAPDLPLDQKTSINLVSDTGGYKGYLLLGDISGERVSVAIGDSMLHGLTLGGTPYGSPMQKQPLAACPNEVPVSWDYDLTGAPNGSYYLSLINAETTSTDVLVQQAD